MPSDAAKTAATVSPTESEISSVAYQLWLDRGCPVGSDQEDWFRAEAMLEDVRRSISHPDTRAESEILAVLRWEGHWEIWESEWGGARWVWDVQYAHAGQ